MSVLVGPFALVVPRLTLDAFWPGDTTAFLTVMRGPSGEAAVTSADRHLVGISFEDDDEAEPLAAHLRALGLVEQMDGDSHDFAVIDAERGPTLPCPWLAWRSCGRGLAKAWLAGTDVEDRPDAHKRDVAERATDATLPDETTDGTAAAITETGDLADRLHVLRLGEEHGAELWLDYATGRIVRTAAPDDGETDASDEVGDDADEANDPNMPGEPDPSLGTWRPPRLWTPDADDDGPFYISHADIVDQAFRDFGLPCITPDADATSRHARLEGIDATYDLHLRVDAQLVACLTTFALRIPVLRRPAVGELLHRINRGTLMGAFELDYDIGVVRFRTGAEVEPSDLDPYMVVSMLATTRYCCDAFHSAILAVTFGAVAPRIAVEQALQRRLDASAAELAATDATAAARATDIDALIRELEMDTHDDTTSQGSTMPDERPIAAPIPNSYVVPGTRLVAGEYPGSEYRSEARTKLAALLDAGVTLFVDLTHAHELVPYEPVLTELAAERGDAVEYRRMPIQDMGVCELPHMHAVLDTIDAALDAGRSAYVHCWGGVGRTGTVVGSFLVRHGTDGDAALAEVNRLFHTMSPAKLRRHPEGSPQTSAQRRFVRQWASADLPR